jgi:hypothetical protein
MTDLEENNVHSFQRPDAEHVDLDPTAALLNGHAGQLQFSKIAGERIRLGAGGNVNDRRPVSLHTFSFFNDDGHGSHVVEIAPRIAIRRTSSVTAELGFSWNSNKDDAQWIDTIEEMERRIATSSVGSTRPSSR